jgi:hypothetical protein
LKVSTFAHTGAFTPLRDAVQAHERGVADRAEDVVVP